MSLRTSCSGQGFVSALVDNQTCFDFKPQRMLYVIIVDLHTLAAMFVSFWDELVGVWYSPCAIRGNDSAGTHEKADRSLGHYPHER